MYFFFSFLRQDCTGKRQVKLFFAPVLSWCFICNLLLCLQLSMIILLNYHIPIITRFHLTHLVFQVMSATFTCCSSSPIPTSFVCLGQGISVDSSILSGRFTINIPNKFSSFIVSDAKVFFKKNSGHLT